MTLETELARELERSLEDLPVVPPTRYLHMGQVARRRRRAARGLATAAVMVVAGGTAVAVLGAGGPATGPVVAQDSSPLLPSAVDVATLPLDADYVAPEPDNPVEAVDGLAGVDSFTTATIPAWAQEYGNHGPVAIAPDGRLWVAPDAVVRRTVVDPLDARDGQAAPITASYAVEAEYPGAPEDFGADVVWVLIAAEGGGPGLGTMDEPGRWTDDFELWVDDETADQQGRPSFAERLVHFADEASSQLAAGDGVELVRQVDGVDLGPGMEHRPRSSAAEVRWAGRTWFVLAQDPMEGGAWYEAYDPAVSATDLEGFVDWAGGTRS